MYAGELTSRLSLHECISHTYLYCLIYFRPFVDDLTKKERSIFEFIYASHFPVLYKKGRRFWYFIQKGGESFWVYMHICFVYAKWGKEFLKNFWSLCMLSPCLCIYVCLVLCTSLHIFMFIVMHKLRGSFYEA